MAHGQPDYGMYGPIQVVHSIADMGELAARLGSICTYDRRGNVMLMEDFESGLNRWQQILAGTGAAIALDTTRYRSSSFSCKLTTGSTISGWVTLYTNLPSPHTSSIGAEFSFSLTADLGSILFYMLLQTATEYHQFRISYNVATGVLTLLDENGASIDLSLPASLKVDSYLFHTLKFVGDYDTNMWKRVLLDDFQFDASANGAYTVANVAAPYFQVKVEASYAVAGNQDAWVDDVIVTQNEP